MILKREREKGRNRKQRHRKEEEEPNGMVTEAVAPGPAVPSSASTPGKQDKAQSHEAVGAHLAAVPTLRGHNTFHCNKYLQNPFLRPGKL